MIRLSNLWKSRQGDSSIPSKQLSKMPALPKPHLLEKKQPGNSSPGSRPTKDFWWHRLLVHFSGIQRKGGLAQKFEGHLFRGVGRRVWGSFAWLPAVSCNIQGAKACGNGPDKQEQTCTYNPAAREFHSNWCKKVYASVFSWSPFSGARIIANTDSSSAYIWYFQGLDLMALGLLRALSVLFGWLGSRVDQSLR